MTAGVFRFPIRTRPANLDDKPRYIRKPLSNYEGFKRLELSLEKLGERKAGQAKLCEVCHRRCRAWRIVPTLTDGKRLVGTKMIGKFLVACDSGPESCAAKLTRAGVVDEAARTAERFARLGLVMR